MAINYKIAAVGDWESVMGFKALGLDTYPVVGAEEARSIVSRLADEDCAILYLTEGLARQMSDVIEKYKNVTVPAIILIPGREGSLGIGRGSMDDAIVRAVGSGII